MSIAWKVKSYSQRDAAIAYDWLAELAKTNDHAAVLCVELARLIALEIIMGKNNEL